MSPEEMDAQVTKMLEAMNSTIDLRNKARVFLEFVQMRRASDGSWDVVVNTIAPSWVMDTMLHVSEIPMSFRDRTANHWLPLMYYHTAKLLESRTFDNLGHFLDEVSKYYCEADWVNDELVLEWASCSRLKIKNEHGELTVPEVVPVEDIRAQFIIHAMEVGLRFASKLLYDQVFIQQEFDA